MNVFASTLGLLLSSFFTDHLQANGLSPTASFAIGATLFAVVSIIVLFYAPLLRGVPLIRRLYIQKKFEGLWLSWVDVKSRPYAIAAIYFDPARSTWVPRGTAFDINLLPAARWQSFSVTMASANRWFFHGNATRLRSNNGKDFRRHDPPGRAVSILTLPDNLTDEFDGLVTDLGIEGDDPKSFKVELVRAESLILKEIFGRTRPPHIERISFAEAARLIRRHQDLGKLRVAEPPPVTIEADCKSGELLKQPVAIERASITFEGPAE